MSLSQYAKAELRAAGLFDPDADFDGAVATNVVALIETFAGYGHSGASAEQTVAIFERLVHYLPLTPLTGEEDEWVRVDDNIEQNKRCPRIFRNGGRSPWDSKFGPRLITFPYMPS